MPRKRVRIFPLFEEVRRITVPLTDEQFGKAVRYALSRYYGGEEQEETDGIICLAAAMMLDQAERYDDFREQQREKGLKNGGQPKEAKVSQGEPKEAKVSQGEPGIPPIPSPSPSPIPSPNNICSKADKPLSRPRYSPPTVDDVRKYCQEQGYAVDAERFVDHYESNGWMVGKNKMKDWKAAVRNWSRKEKVSNGKVRSEQVWPTIGTTI